ncbi:BolA family transcriptional regulator [Roseovarius sp. LXJ103]|uniref:BolA family protein n=1 Tax=Roseovarius carneus TaxID=2853164 RepID=UPI000D60BC3F|nr:BolA family protein [Roseovarius carneus]MBZ8119016.1 BolA family transcriptional regulator [Roseovarius carneus]PWE35334.1 BolA family transcriptional regulator [Pelagicola sp. LXJ1103]
MDRATQIRSSLDQAFAAEHLEVIDESAQHRGHAGAPEEGQSHFRVRLRAPELAPLSRIARHRAVHSAIGPELMGQIHALAIEIES